MLQNLTKVFLTLALPETAISGKSMLYSVLSGVATNGIYSSPLNYKFKADFYQMK